MDNVRSPTPQNFAMTGVGLLLDVPNLTAKELRRQRDRERYAALSVEEKASLVQNNSVNRERKKSASTSGTVLNQSLHDRSQSVNCQPSFQPVPSSTPGVLGELSNLSAVERRRKRARDKYASMSPEEKERLLQKNREYRQRKKEGVRELNFAASATVTDRIGEVLAVSDMVHQADHINLINGSDCENPGKQNHQAKLTPRRQLFADLTNQAFNEVDADSAGDCVLTMSCVIQQKQGGSLVGGKQDHRAMLTPRRQPFADLTNQAFNEVDADSAGDCFLPMSCITQQKQGGRMVVAHPSAIMDIPLTPANVLTRDDGEAEDNDYQNGDTFQEIVQPPSMSRANVELMEEAAIVDDDDNDDDDDESYLMRGRDIEFESYQTAAVSIDASTVTDDKIYHNLPAPSVLERVADCKYCNAKRFQYESPAWCCRKGKIVIANTSVRDELHRFFTNQSDVDARYFREHIRYFNSHFSFTSLGVTLDQRYCNRSSGVYTFRAQGQVYHRIDQLQPGDHGPRHLQLYFYDTDSNLAHWVRRSPDLDVNLIRKILHILRNNPYVHTFRSMGSVQNLDEYRISLNTNIILDQ